MINTQKTMNQPQFDEDGFLLDTQTWTPETAQKIALQDGFPKLTNSHWDVINYLRDHYLRFGALPVTSHVCRVNHLPSDCMTSLFRNTKEAWRIAGLPNPGEEAKTYM